MDRKMVIDRYFSSFRMTEDREHGHNYGAYMKEALQAFAAQDNKQTAYEVYETFLDCYKHALRGGENFLDLLDILQSYEENAALLIDKQRDHYVHSVNVFLLGIGIYQCNCHFREAALAFLEKQERRAFDDVREEFFFRWGMAALFHDIGYPVEITNNQLIKFIGTVVAGDGRDARPYIGYQDEPCLTSMSCAQGEMDFAGMLSGYLGGILPVDTEMLRQALAGLIAGMQKGGRVDHGYYSALALLQHYSFLMDGGETAQKIYRGAVVDAASAILLHNYYNYGLLKEPFSLAPLSASVYPLGYLLILCDELQEWNRKAYGIVDRRKVQAADSRMEVDDGSLKIHYITSRGMLAPDFAEKKKKTLERLLNLDAIFPNGVRVTATTRSELYLADIRTDDGRLPRPFLENVEQLSRRIHERYNEAQLKTHPDTPLAYPDWESLPDDLKYSNIRQARSYFGYLDAAGMYAAQAGDAASEVPALPDELVEALARSEHENWMAERLANGWQYAPEKDAQKKHSPWLVPYEELPEEIRQLDRDAICNILPLFHEIGLHVYRR